MTNTLLHNLLSNKGTIILLSLFLIFSNHVSSQRRKDLQEFNLNGCVKTIDRVKYDAKWNNGNIVKGERSSEDFQENYIATFTPDGFLLEQFFLDMSETVYSKVINLNSADKLISYGFDDLDRLACLFIKHFNNDGQLVETLQYNLNGDLEGRYTYHYSSENDLLCEMNLYTPDSLLFKERIIYNAENKIVSKATYDSDDNLYWKEIYEYTNEGSREFIANVDNGFSINEFEVNEYDSCGNTLRSLIYSDKVELINQVEYKYDQYNNLVYMNSNNNIVNEYQYEYDSEGNWISQIIFENERPEYIIERQIEYYKRGEFKIK